MLTVCAFGIISAGKTKPRDLFLVNASTAFLETNPKVYLVSKGRLYDPDYNRSGIFLCTDGVVALEKTGFRKIALDNPAIPTYRREVTDALFAQLAKEEVNVVLLSEDLAAPEADTLVFATTANKVSELNARGTALVKEATREEHVADYGEVYLLTDGTHVIFKDEFYPLIPTYDDKAALEFQRNHRRR